MKEVQRTAAAYIRVSTEDQTEYSPEAQLVEIRRYAGQHEFHIPDRFVFVDEGISGKHTSNRAAFNRMIGMAKTKPRPFEAVLLWKFSRFARNREDSIVYKSMLRRQLGIDVISISEPVGDDKMSIIMEAMIEAMDEYYSINLAEEVKRGMSEKARRGELQTAPSFGYAVKDHSLLPIEPEASCLKEIFQRFLSGQNTLSIAKWLNSIGLTTHRGGAFENRTVEYILRNPVYIGKLRWNPSGRTRNPQDAQHAILACSAHPPLVSEETWQAVQEKLRSQKALDPPHARPSFDRKDWLSGIVRCACCGSTLIFTKPHYFKCSSYVRGGCSTSQHISAELLHSALLQRLRLDTRSPVRLRSKPVPHPPDSIQSRDVLDHRRQALHRRLERLREAYLCGAESLEDYKKTKESLERELASLSAPESAVSPEAVQEKSRTIIPSVDLLESDAISLERKYEAVRAILERCTFDKELQLMRITYRLSL